MKAIALVTVATALAGCAMQSSQNPNAESQQRLNQLLAGKVAGPPVECLPSFQTHASSLITPDAIAFETSPSQVYVSSTAGSGCEGVGGPSYTLVATARGGGSLCAGDTVQVRDLQTGVMAGACTLARFTPYRRP